MPQTPTILRQRIGQAERVGARVGALNIHPTALSYTPSLREVEERVCPLSQDHCFLKRMILLYLPGAGERAGLRP